MRRRANLVALAVLLLGATLALYDGVSKYRENKAVMQSRFDALQADATTQLANRMQLYAYGLRGTRGAVIGAGGAISHAAFQRYAESRNLAREFPGARGFGFIRRVAPGQEAAFVQAVRADGQPDFKLHSLAENRDDRFVVQYIEPAAPNLPAIGLDIASEPIRRATALQSVADDGAVMSAPITLVQATGVPLHGLAVLLPVYRDEAPRDTPQERLAAVLGWAFTPLVIDEVLADFDFKDGEFSMTLADADDNSAGGPFYRSVPAAERPVAGLEETATLRVFGRIWRITVAAQPPFLEHQNLSRPLLSGSLIFCVSFLLAVLLYVYTRAGEREDRASIAHARLAAIMEGSDDAVVGVTPDGMITDWNRGAESIFGYPAAEAVGKHYPTLVTPAENVESDVDLIALASQGDSRSGYITVQRRKDGSLIDVAATISPIRDKSGRIVGAAKVIRDITQQKAAENQILELNATLEQQVKERTAELTESREALALALEGSDLAIFDWNLETDLVRLSEQWNVLLGGPPQAVVISFSELRQLVHPDDRAQLGEALRRALKGEIPSYEVEHRVRTRDGRWLWINSRAKVAERDATGRARRVTGTNADISTRKREEEELRRAKEAAEVASRSKSEFVANMSHEIRTPMNAVLGMLQLLERCGLPQREAGYVGKAQSAAHALLKIINDILDFSKVEAGKLTIEQQPFALDALLHDVGTVLAANVTNTAVELLFDIGANVPGSVIGDTLRLQQVLINLAGNALKFTPQGEVVLGVRETGREVEHGSEAVTLEFSVTDTGIGISAEQREHIFQQFTQAEASTTRRFGGTGLGLTISRSLVALMGGRLELESEPGHGSRFFFSLKLGLPPHSAAHALPTLSSAPLRVLVIDDNNTSRTIMHRMGGILGWDVDTAADGLQGMERITAALAGGARYDAIFIDRHLPDTDGGEISRRTRALYPAGRAPLLIMVSVHARDVPRATERDTIALFDAFLMKPVTLSDLHDVVMSAGKPAVGDGQAPAKGARLRGLTLLVVEDNPINRLVASGLLETEGAQVFFAEHGEAGVERVKNANPPYDAVLMDIQMPGMDGYEATRMIRAELGRKAPPIIAITANTTPADREMCLAAGMVDHVGKPFELDNIVASILRHTAAAAASRRLPQDGAAGGAEKAVAAAPVRNAGLTQHTTSATVSAVGSTSSAGSAGSTPLHITQALQRFGGKRPIYLRALNSFRDEARVLAAQTRQAGEAGDRGGYERALHTLRGAAGTVGAHRIETLTGELRELTPQLTAHGKPSPAATALDRLDDEVRQAVAAVDAYVGQPAPATAPPPELQPALLRARLAELATYLASSNMAAVAAFSALQAPLLAAAPQDAQALELCLRRLDFETAHDICRRIADQLERRDQPQGNTT